jgi:hypothetical protein
LEKGAKPEGRRVAGKSSAVADVAAQAGPDQGRAVAHSPAAPGEPAGDLFAFDQEMGALAGQTIAPPARRGPGRPVGSVNRTTLQLQRLLMARGARDPAEFLSSIQSMDVRALARALYAPEGGDLTPAMIDMALGHQRRAAEALMPYFHQKMPIAVQHSGDGQRPLIMIHNEPAAGPVVAARGEAMSVHDAQDVELDQGVSGREPAPSHGDGSHGGANDQ